VPLPPRGWWARKAAGRPVIQVALPLRPPGLDTETTIGGGADRWRWFNPPDEEFLGPIPPPPSFEEPIEQVRARVEATIGKTGAVQRVLEQLHPVVARLLREDHERRAKVAGQSYLGPWDKPLYDTPLQQRRLKLLSNILASLARCGCRADLGQRPELAHPQDDFTITVGSQRIGLRVSAEEHKPAGRGKAGAPRATTTLQVEAEGKVWEDVNPRDGEVVREIVVAVVWGAEEVLRARAASSHACWLERRAAIIERRRKEAEEAARRERERLAEFERKRIERLLGEAQALRKARTIRAYVEEVRAAAPPVPQVELDAWAEWALAQADRIDPVITGAFLTTRSDA
jgi:hypothetical protein